MNKTKRIKAETLKINDSVRMVRRFGRGASQAWGTVEQIELGGRGVYLVFGDGGSRWVPCQAGRVLAVLDDSASAK